MDHSEVSRSQTPNLTTRDLLGSKSDRAQIANTDRTCNYVPSCEVLGSSNSWSRSCYPGYQGCLTVAMTCLCTVP